jgi:hypothetical protein
MQSAMPGRRCRAPTLDCWCRQHHHRSRGLDALLRATATSHQSTVPGEGARRGGLISGDHVDPPGWGCRCVRLTPTPRASLLGPRIIKSCGRAIAATHLTHVRPCLCAVARHPRLKPRVLAAYCRRRPRRSVTPYHHAESSKWG